MSDLQRYPLSLDLISLLSLQHKLVSHCYSETAEKIINVHLEIFSHILLILDQTTVYEYRRE